MSDQLTILAVDDVDANLRLMRSVLGMENYNVLTAENGVQALSIAESARPDLILLDINMPVMDGLEACQKLKENAALVHIPVIFLTALDDPETVIKGLSLGRSIMLPSLLMPANYCRVCVCTYQPS